MAKSSFEISTFTSGVVGSPSETDIPNDAAAYSTNINPVSEDGTLQAISNDQVLSNNTGFTSIAKTVQTLKILRSVENPNGDEGLDNVNVTAIAAHTDGYVKLTSSNHGLSTGDIIDFTNNGGGTDINGYLRVLDSVDTNNFTVEFTHADISSAPTGSPNIGTFILRKDVSQNKQVYGGATIQAVTYNSSYEEKKYIFYFVQQGSGADPNLEGYTSVSVAISNAADVNAIAAALNTAINNTDGFTSTVSTDTITISPDVNVDAPLFYIPDNADTAVPQQDATFIEINTSAILPTTTVEGKGTIFKSSDMASVNMDKKVYTLFGIDYDNDKIFKWEDIYNTNGENVKSEFADNITNDNVSTIQQRNKNLFIGLGSSEIFSTKWIGYIESTQINKDIDNWFIVDDKLDSFDASAAPNNYDYIISQQIHDNDTAFNEEQSYHATVTMNTGENLQTAFQSGILYAAGNANINHSGKVANEVPKIGWCFKISNTNDTSDSKLAGAKGYKYDPTSAALVAGDVFMVVDNTSGSEVLEYLGNTGTTEPAFMIAIVEGTPNIHKISTAPGAADFNKELDRVSTIDISELIDDETITTISQCRSPLTSGISVTNTTYLYSGDGTVDSGHVSDQRCRALHLMYWIGTSKGNLYRLNLTDFHSQHSNDTYKGPKADAKMVLDYSNIARCQDSQYDGNFKHWYGGIYGAKRFNEYGYSENSNLRTVDHDLEATDTTIPESSGAWVESYSWSREPVNSNIAGIVETWNNATDTSRVPTAVRNNVAERYVYDDDTDSTGDGANPGSMTHHHAQTNGTGDLKDYAADKTIKIQSHANDLNHGFDTGNLITGFINKDGKGHANYQGNTIVTKIEGLNEFKAQGTHPGTSGNEDSFPYYSCKVWVLWKRKDGSAHEKWDLMLYNFYPTTVQSNSVVVYDRTPPYDECEKNIMSDSHGVDQSGFWKQGDCNFYIQKSSMMLGKGNSEASNNILPQSSSYTVHQGAGPNNIFVMRRDGSAVSWESTGYYSHTSMGHFIGFDGSLDGSPRLTTPFSHTLITPKPLGEVPADYAPVTHSTSLSFSNSNWQKGANKHQVCFAATVNGKMAIEGFFHTWMLNDSERDNSHSVRQNQFKNFNDSVMLFKVTDTGSAKNDTRTFAGRYASTTGSNIAHTNNTIPWHYNNGGKFKKRCIYSTSDNTHISTRGSGEVVSNKHNLYYTSGTYSLYDGSKLTPTIVPFSNSSDTSMVQGQVGDYLYIDRKWLSGEPRLGTTGMFGSASSYIATGESEEGTSFMWHRKHMQFRPYTSTSGSAPQTLKIRGTDGYLNHSGGVNTKAAASGDSSNHHGERFNQQIVITSIKSAYSITSDTSTAGVGGGDEYYYNQTDSRVVTNRYSGTDSKSQITYDINRYAPGFETIAYHAAEMRPFQFQGGPLDLVRTLQPIENDNMTYDNQILASTSSTIGGEFTSTLSAYEDKVYDLSASSYSSYFSNQLSGLLNKVDQTFYSEYTTHSKIIPRSLVPKKDINNGTLKAHSIWGSANAQISNVNKQFLAPMDGEGYDYTDETFAAFLSDDYIISNPLLVFSNEISGGTEFPQNANVKYKISLLYDGYQESPLSPFFYDKTMTADKASQDVTVNIDENFEFNPRVTHIVVYRKNTPNDLYRLVKEVPLDSKTWINESNINKFTFRDDKRFASYAALTGINEERVTTSLNYALSAQINDELFVTLAWHKDAEDDVKKYVYKSKPGNFSQFDYKKDFLVLPNIPTALASFNGKIYAFDRNNTYVINPQQMFIEDTFEGVGCLSQDAFVVTEFGMCFADANNIYLHNGSIAKPIGTNILDVSTYEGINLGWQKSVEYSENTLDVDPFVFYDGQTNSFVCFVHASSDVNPDSSVSKAWVYSISRNRWDYWESPNVKKAIQGMDGDIIISDGNLIYNYKKDSTKRDWKWLSKKLSLTKQTNTKRMSRIKLQGSPTLDTISTPPKWNDDLVVYVDGEIQQLTIPNINPAKNKGFTKEFSGCFWYDNADLTDAQTTINVKGLNGESITGALPPIGTYIMLEQEVMLVTAHPSSTSLTVTRGQLGTTAVAHDYDVSTQSTVGLEGQRIYNICPIIKLPSKCKGKNIEVKFSNQKGIVDSFAIQFIDKGGK